MTLYSDIVTLNNSFRKGQYYRVYDDETQKTQYLREKNYEKKYIEAYEVNTTTHYSSRKNKSNWEYEIKGTFKNKPSIEKLETMSKNTLKNVFNKGEIKGGKSVPTAVMNDLSDIRGLEIRKVVYRVGTEPNITNTLSANLKIKNHGTLWEWFK